MNLVSCIISFRTVAVAVIIYYYKFFKNHFEETEYKTDRYREKWRGRATQTQRSRGKCSGKHREKGSGRRVVWQLTVWCVTEIIPTPDRTGMQCCSLPSHPVFLFPFITWFNSLSSSTPPPLDHPPQHIFIFLSSFLSHFMSSLKWAIPLLTLSFASLTHSLSFGLPAVIQWRFFSKAEMLLFN